MDKNHLIMLGVGVGAVALAMAMASGTDGAHTDDQADPAGADLEPTMADELRAAAAGVRNAVMPTDAAGMVPSPDLLMMLRRGEALRLRPYRLGDKGTTIGWGHFYADKKDGTQADGIPSSITAEEADQIFMDDVERRSAKWVRTFVRVEITQKQFDALCSMAFNLSPGSFKKIAAAVNDGEDPEDAALEFVLAGTDKERGLRNRRAREIALYRQGVYA